MQFETLDQMTATYQHVYLSPHLDDAALSCGGVIALQRAAGERVLVVTLCTAAPAPDSHFSALAEEFHSYWQLSPAEVVAARLHEEQAALARLDVDHYWGGMSDAIYRHPTAYYSRATLFATPAADDPLFPDLCRLFAELRAQFPQALFYIPLGVGSHVDHLITHRAALECAGSPRAFYEDFPYVARPGALEQRMATVTTSIAPRLVAIEATLNDKLEAVGAYASQLGELFGGHDAMVESVTTYARSLTADRTAAERLWLPQQEG